MDGAIVVSQLGGPEVLEWSRKDPGEPGAGEVLVRHTAIGLNFIDVYHRTGLYPLELPFTPGVEGAGVVEGIGSGVEDLQVGDRVAYTGNGPVGSYCEGRVLPRSRLFVLPDSIDDDTAGAIMLKGCTVEYLVRRTYPVKSGDWVLLHAAAGGVGLLASQWLEAVGAHVIGTVGSEEKAELAEANGCEHTILYRDEDVPARVKEITQGRGVDVAYDSVGAATFSWFAGLAPAPRHDGDLRQCLRTGGADLAAVTRPERIDLPHQADGRALLRHPGRRGRGCGRPLRTSMSYGRGGGRK